MSDVSICNAYTDEDTVVGWEIRLLMSIWLDVDLRCPLRSDRDAEAVMSSSSLDFLAHWSNLGVTMLVW